jgi:uncharacterized membrane protein
MESTVGIYESHKTALDAIEVLKNKGFPVKQLSLIGEAIIIDDQMHIKSNDSIKNAGVSAGVVLGTTIGVLSGVGIFAIPGLGFIFGAGAVVGALAGFDIGLVGGGIVSLLTLLGLKKDNVIKYKEHLDKGNFLVIAQGNEKEVEKANDILFECGKHLELCMIN